MTDTNSTLSVAEQVNQIHQYFATGVTKTAAWRIAQLNALKQLVEDNQARIASALQADLGKGEVEAWSSEIGFCIGDIAHTLKHLKKWMSPRKVSTPVAALPGRSYLQPEPLGTVLIIGAWNYPWQLVVAPLIAAISAGNCAVIKPSELSEHTANLLAELLPQYMDTQAIQVIQGGVEETTALLATRFDHIFYTGGEQVGKIVMRAAAEYLTPVTLELGGKSPCVVDSNTNLSVTAARIVWSKWMNAGQTCVAPDYVIVEAAMADKLVKAIRKKLVAFYGKDPKQSKDYGRIVNARHFQRLQGYLDGQQVVHGGEVDPSSCYMAPTIVMQPAQDSSVMQEEIFGPILPIVTVDSIEQAPSLINQRSKPLAMYIYSKNKAFQDDMLTKCSAGSVAVNDGFMFMINPELPFGGVGNSGMGAYHGRHGFDNLSHLKSVMRRSFWFDAPVRYPPFSKTKFKLLKKLL